MEQMNSRVSKLENLIQKLSPGLNIEENLGSNSTNINSKGFNSQPYNSEAEGFQTFKAKKETNPWALILHELKNKNPTEAFKIALKSEGDNLLKLIEKISIYNINIYLRYTSNKRSRTGSNGKCYYLLG
jgi:hypothetical protein